MGTLLRKLAVKAAQKAMKVDPTDTFTQMNVDDLISIVRDVFL